MATNRFMQPWKRDFSADYYMPNFDAWAKVLQQKEQSFGDDMNFADSIEKLIPEGGFMTTDMRKTLLDDVRKKKTELVNSVYEGGTDPSSFRRRLSQLASDVVSDPRVEALKTDFQNRALGTRIAASQTLATDRQKALNPETGEWRQEMDPSKVGPQLYSMIETQDLVQPFLKLGEPLKPLLKSFKQQGKEIEIIQKPDGTFETYIKGEKINRKFTDFNRLFQFLSPDGQFGDYAKSAFRNFEGKERAYWNDKYDGLTPEQREQQFYHDLLSTNLIRIFSEEQDEEFLTRVPTGKTGSGREEKSGIPEAVASTERAGIAYRFDKLETNVGNAIFNRNELNSKISNHGIKHVENINRTLTDKLHNPDASLMEFIARNNEGKYILNQETISQLENPNIEENLINLIWYTPLDSSGLTAFDTVSNMNNELNSMIHQREEIDRVLEDLGLSGGEVSELTGELMGQAYNIAKDKLIKYRSFDRIGEGELFQSFSDESIIPTEEQINQEFEKLLKKPEHQRIKEVNKQLKEFQSRVFSPVVNGYFPLALNNQEEKMVKGWANYFKQLAMGDWQEARNPFTDELFESKELDNIKTAFNQYYRTKNADDLAHADLNNFEIFFDAEESAWKALLSLHHDGLSSKLKQKGPAVIEVPLGIGDGSQIMIGGQMVSVPEALGIEGDPQILEDLKRVNKSYNEKGFYRSVLEDQYGTRFHIDANILNKNANLADLNFQFKAVFDDNTRINLSVANPREAVVLKKLVSDLSSVVQDDSDSALIAGIQLVQAYIQNRQLPSLEAKSDEEIENFVSRVVGRNVAYVDNNSQFYTVKGADIKTMDKNLHRAFEHLANIVQVISTDIGEPVKINLTSAHDPSRGDINSPYYNPHSSHITGEAFDISYFNPETGKEDAYSKTLIEALSKQIEKNIEVNKWYSINLGKGKYNFILEEGPEVTKHFHFQKPKKGRK